MDHEQSRDELRTRQQQRQRHQQDQQHPYRWLGRELPAKQHQSKHNPVSEATKVPQRGTDQ
jgi:hypothetical protein